MLKRLLSLANILLLTLAGACHSSGTCAGVVADYGVFPPRTHPTVEFTSFSYTPASPIHIGDTLTVTATTNQAVTNANMHAVLPAQENSSLVLNDDGQPPDVQAGDGIWTGERTWTASMGTSDNGSLVVMLEFANYEYDSQLLYGTITVLPEESE
ncbi:hypothetical protein JW859_05305 [bacterium]|nr:hypothetical protein [bacterium]